MQRLFWLGNAGLALLVGVAGTYFAPLWWCYAVLAPLSLVALHDTLQPAHSLQRNFPLFAHVRWLMETLRPGVQQYFVENNKEGRPFDRERRSLVYRRAKGAVDTLSFGTESRVYEAGYEWINHAMAPVDPVHVEPRIAIGNAACTKPYSAALMNISAMSYGSLSKNAVLALNRGAKIGNFYHNTGEGGLSPYHLEPGGDLVWQLGTGYFGARDAKGQFSPDAFAERAVLANVKMVEIKLSQGAKPGHGGILPASKVNQEIATIRGVPVGKAVISPPGHTAFPTPAGLIAFVQQLRTLSGGKPIGFKLCLGRREDFFAIAKAMHESGIYPDFITVDGAEGGTGAAPLEFSNSVGTPLKEGLTLVHNTLVGLGLRQHVRLVAAGKIVSGFDMARHLALGADLVNCARAMMFSLGCIQAQRCNTNDCPTGVATQDPKLSRGLVVADKSQRVANFQHATVKTLLEVVGAAGLHRPVDLRPDHIYRRVSARQVCSYEEIYPSLAEGSLLVGEVPAAWQASWNRARPDAWAA